MHGSAPDIAGRDIANPSGLLEAAVQMLVHIGAAGCAARIRNAWLATLEDGIHTADIFDVEKSRRKVGTAAFADAVIERLGRHPRHLPVADFHPVEFPVFQPIARTAPAIQLDGVDVFLHWDEAERDASVLGARVEALGGPDFKATMITNRGVQVWPTGFPETFRTDHWRVRFLATPGRKVDGAAVISLLCRVHGAGLKFIKTEHLCSFDGKPGYSLGQGQ